MLDKRASYRRLSCLMSAVSILFHALHLDTGTELERIGIVPTVGLNLAQALAGVLLLKELVQPAAS